MESSPFDYKVSTDCIKEKRREIPNEVIQKLNEKLSVVDLEPDIINLP